MTEERKEELHQLGILKICQYLHMHNTKASDRLSDKDWYEYTDYLYSKKNKWEDGLANSRGYDSAVYLLLCATLQECQQR